MVMERPADHFGTPPPSFPADGAHYHPDNSQEPQFHGGRHQPDQRYQHNFHGDQNDSNGHQINGTSNNSLPSSGQKRPFSHPNSIGCASFVKLYVVGIPKTSNEQDIKSVFGEHGQILEVVLLKDKRTGLQQECCFVKYATMEQAERAIGAFHCQYTFPGVAFPMKVKYADGERERLGSIGVPSHKLYAGCLNRQASKWDIEEIFAPFGVIEEIFLVRDDFKQNQNRGCAFVQYSCRDMALAAIRALNGTYLMRGCDQPLVVRFAEPKKPRIGDSRPTPLVNETTNGYPMSNEVQAMKCSDSECRTANGTAALSSNDDIECEWSEHVSPDGDMYYYNCITCESRWEKPEEYALNEQQLDNLEEQQELR